MGKLRRVNKVTTFAILGCILLAAIGYIVDSASRGAIEAAERQQAVASGKVGIAFISGLEVSASQFQVGSRVVWPFVVVGYYAVPFDIHVTVYETKYLVMPWGAYELSRKTEHPL